MRRTILLVLAVGTLSASVARAQPESSASAAAREHFTRGLTHAKGAELALAAAEFEAAYAQSPHYSVLYNLGQAYTALGRAVEAVSAFERYLREAGSSVDGARREEVRRLIELNRSRLGRLLLRVVDPSTRVWLDGKSLSAAQLARPFAVAAGEHSLLSASGVGMPLARSLTLRAGELLSIDIPLEQSASGAEQRPGLLQIDCGVPAVQVVVDGAPHGITPLSAPLMVAPGQHQLGFERLGYEPSRARVTVSSGALTKSSCALRASPQLATAQRAGLELDVVPSDARVLVDGSPFAGGVLPAGPHSVVVKRAGYVDHQRNVELAAGRTLTFSARLSLSAEQQRQKARRWTSGWVLAGSGGALVATGIGLQIFNSQRYDDWSARKASSSDSDNLSSAQSIQRIDDLSIGLMVAGASLIGVGTWLLWPSAPDAN